MKTTTPEKPLCKYAAHGEPGTEAWIEVYAENTAVAEQKHKVYAHAPELLNALEAVSETDFFEAMPSSVVEMVRAAIEKALGK